MHGASMPSSGTAQAPSHPAQKGPGTTGLPHAGQPGHGPKVKLPRLKETKSRGGRRDVIHDKANSFLFLSSPPTSLPENGWKKKKKRLNRIKKTESTWEQILQVFAAPVEVDCP